MKSRTVRRIGVVTLGAAALLCATLLFAQTYASLNYMEAGGASWVVGGALNIASGGLFKIGGTTVTATAAELNALHSTGLSAGELGVLDSVIAGTATASKAAVLGTNKNLDTLVIADGGLALGSGAGTAVTATAAEINSSSDGVGNSLTLTAAAGGSNVSNVTITVKDGSGATVAAVHQFDVWLSDSATCAGLTSAVASGTVQAKSASGADVVVYTAKKSLRVQTLATGVYTLEITDTAKSLFFVCGTAPGTGKAVASAQLTAGSYG